MISRDPKLARKASAIHDLRLLLLGRHLALRRHYRPPAAAGRYDSHGDYVLERFVHRHVELDYRASRHHYKIAAGGIRRRGDVDADVVALQVVHDVASGSARHESD